MKNTKKLLMILAAIVVLATSVFAVVSSAVIAGEGTTINEYVNMKKVESVGFEDGKNTYSLANKGKLPSAADQANSGKVVRVNNTWYGVGGIYDGSISEYFYMIDYTYNKDVGADLYIQPVLGQLNDIERTPTNGFVSEFDIAFFSPVEPVLQEKKVQATDADGNPQFDENGDPIMVTETQPVYDSTGKPMYTEKRDEDGNIVYEKNEEGQDVAVMVPVTEPVYEPVQEPLLQPVFDENGNVVKDADGNITYVQQTDENGNLLFNDDGTPKYVEMVDEDGNVIMVDKVVKQDFVNLANAFNIGMYNTTTYMDGRVDLISFKAAGNKVACSFGSTANPNLIETPVSYSFNPDEWQHITIQYNAETMMTYVYISPSKADIDRTLVGVFSATDDAENQGLAIVPVYPLSFRIGGSIRGGRVGLDNFLSYQGTTVHDPDLVQKMENEEMFLYFINILEDSKNSAVIRHQAYSDIGEHVISNYYENGSYKINMTHEKYAELKEAVDKFLSYKRDDDGKLSTLEQAVKDENAKEFIAYVQRVKDVKRTLSNISERSAKINMADEFLASVGTMINRNSDEYKTAVSELGVMRSYIALDTNANSFMTNMTLFMRSVNYGASVDRLEAHYNVVKSYYDAGVTSPDDIKATDSAGYSNLIAAIKNYLGDETTGALSAEELIALARRDSNSVRFINVINLLKAKTVGSWAEDDALDNEVETLWYRAHTILRDDPYSDSYEGFEAALVVFKSANDYFWPKLQNEFIETIKSKLDTYNNADKTYIDKAGICTYVDQYIALNAADIDPNNATLQREIERNETYKAQLSILVGDYKNLLVQNSTKFVNTMKKAAEYVSYVDLKPLYDEATEYYYTMDLIGEEIEYYVSEYEALRVKMLAIESDCDLFIVCANGLASAATRDEKYLLLSEAYGCLGNLDSTYEGVASAKVTYDAAYAAYVADANTVNGEIDETVEVASAVRGNWDFDGIVAFVKNLFN